MGLIPISWSFVLTIPSRYGSFRLPPDPASRTAPRAGELPVLRYTRFDVECVNGWASARWRQLRGEFVHLLTGTFPRSQQTHKGENLMMTGNGGGFGYGSARGGFSPPNIVPAVQPADDPATAAPVDEREPVAPVDNSEPVDDWV